MGRYDLFYAENRSAITTTATTATTSGATTLRSYGSDFTLASAPSPNFATGQLVTLSGGGKTAYCTVVYVSGTTVTVLPLQSSADSTGVLDNSFPSGSTIAAGSGAPQPAGTLVIDLTDAPFTTATYLIVATGNLTTNVTSAAVGAHLRVAQLLRDPFSGTGGAGACLATFHTDNTTEWVPFHGATTVTLSGGQRYEFTVGFWAATANAEATFDECRIAAIRYSSITAAGSGTSAETTTASTALQTHLSLATNLAAGDYLIVATWVGGLTSLSYDAVVEVQNSATVLSSSQFVPRATSDYLSGGFMGIVTLAATNALTLKYRTTNALGTAKIKNAFLAAIPISATSLAAGYQATASNASVTTASTAYTTLFTATSSSLPAAGRFIQVASASIGGTTNRYRVRAVTPGGFTTDVLSGFRAGATSSNALATFAIFREVLASGTSTTAYECRTATSGGTVRANNIRVSWLAEKADLVPRYNTGINVVADMELGGQIQKNWNTTAVANRFWKHLDSYILMSRVIVNGTAFTAHATTETQANLRSNGATLSSGEWYWDAANHDLYLHMGAGLTPADAGQNVVIVPLGLYARSHVDLQDTSGNYLPYESRISGVPSLTEELRSSNSRFEASRSIGSIDLAVADGAFDDLIVRHSMESYRVLLRRGWAELSDKLDDFDVYANAVTGLPSSDFSTLTIKLFDANLLLSKPVSSNNVTVYEGATPRDDQPIPVVYGSVKRLIAYRISNTTGSGSFNEFKFAAHGVKSVSAVYIDGTNVAAIASANVTLTSTYTNVGNIRVKNDAFSDPASPQDSVYVDCVGKTTDGTSAGTALDTPGVILRDILLSYGGLATTGIAESSFRLLDCVWRSQFVASGASSRYSRIPPSIGLVALDETVEEAVGRLAGDVFAYISTTPYGRICVGVPDLDAGNLVENPGFEVGFPIAGISTSSIWPWRTASNATAATTTARKYDGLRSMEISNGSTPDADANVWQEVIFPVPGKYVVTCLAAYNSGVRDAFTIAVQRPGGSTDTSEAFALTSGQWSRASFEVTCDPGEVGRALIRIYPAAGSTTATTISLDNVEAYLVSSIATDANSNPTSVEFSDEHYYEAAITYNVNLEDTEHASKVVISDSIARLMGTTTPEGRYTIESSSRAELGEPLLKDVGSAAGIAAALVNYYSRMRHTLAIELLGQAVDLPCVGDYVYVRNNRRVPELANGYPIWRVTSCGFDPEKATLIEVAMERQTDPVDDRMDISPDSIPMGATLVTLSSSAVTDFTEVTSLQDRFVIGAATPDTTSAFGAMTHTHTLGHDHTMTSHTHTWSATSVDGKASNGEYAGAWPAIYGPSAEFVAAGASHAHSISGTGTSAASTGTSSITAQTSRPGPTEPSYKRVKFMQRTAATATTIDQNLIIGYMSASIPAGWTRVTGLDSLYLKGATGKAAPSTTVATSTFVPSFSGSTLKVGTAANIAINKRLTITSGASSMRVMVTAISGTDLTVVPLCESGDTIQNYSVGSTVTGDAETVGTSFTVRAHDHFGEVPSHTHEQGSHVHLNSSSLASTTAIPDQSISVYPSGYTGSDWKAAGVHSHILSASIPAGSDTSGSATGTITEVTTAVPDTLELVWIQPSSAAEKALPAGAIILWTVSSTPPTGYAVLTEANGKMLAGAATSASSGGKTGGHSHAFTGSQHTMSHNHGGTAVRQTDDADVSTSANPQFGNGATEVGVAAAAYGRYPNYQPGHGHDALIAIGTSSPTLSQRTGQTSSSDSAMPPYQKVLVCKKL